MQSVKREQTASKTFEIVKDTLFVFKDVQTDDSWTVGVAVIGSGAEHSIIFLKTLSTFMVGDDQRLLSGTFVFTRNSLMRL